MSSSAASTTPSLRRALKMKRMTSMVRALLLHLSLSCQDLCMVEHQIMLACADSSLKNFFDNK